MKAILKFNLSDADDQIDYKNAVEGTNMYNALFEITHHVKKNVTWWIDQQNNCVDGYEVLDKVMEKIQSILDDRYIIIE